MSDGTPRLSEYAEVEQGVIKIDASEINQTIAIPATPNNELRKLVEEWRESMANHARKAGKAESNEGTSYQEGVSHAYEDCANKLKELL